MMNERAKGEQLGPLAWHDRGVAHFETLSLPVEVRAKLTQLVAIIGDLGPVVTAFSGGADSAFVAAVAHEVLGV